MDRLLESARSKFLSPDPAIRYESFEKLWDAWERLKTIEPGKDKKESISNMLDKLTGEPELRKTLSNEASELTRIGNTFRIRHSETTKIQLQKNEHVDYLFHGLFSLINLINKSIS